MLSNQIETLNQKKQTKLYIKPDSVSVWMTCAVEFLELNQMNGFEVSNRITASLDISPFNV